MCKKPQYKNPIKNQKLGFTLLELLIVIAIIGILASMIVVGFSDTKDKARLANAKRFSQGVRSSVGAYVVGEWKFDEGSGTTARDTSGNGNHGTIYGATQADGVFGKALQFSGGDDRVDLITNSINFGVQVTVAAWIKTSSVNISQAIYFAQGPSVLSTVQSIYFRVRNTNVLNCLTRQESDWNDYAVTGSKIVTDGQWHHVVFVMDGAKLSLYVDGVLDATRTISAVAPFNNTAYHRIGYQFVGNAQPFNGLIDDVAVYKEVFTIVQVQQLYADGLTNHNNEILAVK